MAELSVEYINPFLLSASNILKSVCQIDVAMDRPYVKKSEFQENSVIIMIGVTGVVRGQVLIALGLNTAKDIAGKMMMMPVEEINEIAESAISELGNMILGNAATILSTKGIVIDITPPSVCIGNLTISNNFAQNICVPMKYDGDKLIELYFALKQE